MGDLRIKVIDGWTGDLFSPYDYDMVWYRCKDSDKPNHLKFYVIRYWYTLKLPSQRIAISQTAPWTVLRDEFPSLCAEWDANAWMDDEKLWFEITISEADLVHLIMRYT